jgi:hypothetical protein
MVALKSLHDIVAGLPDGIFSYQKYQFGYILEDLGVEIFGIYYGNLE